MTIDILGVTYEMRRGTPYSAGLDLTVADFTVVLPGAMAVVDTGQRVAIEPGHWGMLALRSGTAKDGLMLANGVGVIDADYRGPIKMMLWNWSKKQVLLERGQRIGQLIIMPYSHVKQVHGWDLDTETERGEGGFGSTGQ